MFDLWYLMSKGIPINDGMIRSKMQWYKKEYDSADLIHAIKSFEQDSLAMDLNKFLPKNYRPFLKDLQQKTLEKLAGH